MIHFIFITLYLAASCISRREEEPIIAQYYAQYEIRIYCCRDLLCACVSLLFVFLFLAQ